MKGRSLISVLILVYVSVVFGSALVAFLDACTWSDFLFRFAAQFLLAAIFVLAFGLKSWICSWRVIAEEGFAFLFLLAIVEFVFLFNGWLPVRDYLFIVFSSLFILWRCQYQYPCILTEMILDLLPSKFVSGYNSENSEFFLYTS
ncbi:hypothetical protein COT97_04830 [Candidatus Falkowbacteria bacterium CG10_big_fil_rev_8_21_14_0_10_39_11]|uniref:Uncharacterized protein n=1 Tax=Candidatus Falkowbacteria bacterium CG10_big_fil_rev_8_21_14_0_10_39_11 TaxID=1974565 RepID=A0A2H0V3Y3_9BACT|nr:MAG: hypothetical protein COT97_04830 [Candidatus Falkowbacteria bacterium CG10_big_fil_rev_8_21_14_0_10_39_11]